MPNRGDPPIKRDDAVFVLVKAVESNICFSCAISLSTPMDKNVLIKITKMEMFAFKV